MSDTMVYSTEALSKQWYEPHLARLLLTNIQPNGEQPSSHLNSLTNHIGKLA